MAGKCARGKEKYPHLFEPVRIGNIRMKNRIIAAPTSPSMITTEGHFTPEMTAYLEEKAKGGVGVVTYGEAIVHSATGKSHNKQLQLDSFGVKQGMAQVARAIHNGGAYANIQLSHGGMYGGLASVGGDQDRPAVAYGPSRMTMPAGEVEEMPREMIFEIVESYKTSAKLCKDCGFDMVQVHAAHGWLFSQFLSPAFNKRTDEFGGSLENRARFLLMALDAVREGVGPHFPIEIRISGDDLSTNGLGMEDCIKVAKMVEDKVDLYNVSCGNHEDPALFCRTHPSAFYPRGVNVYLAAEIKKQVNKPVACVGSLNNPAQMEQIIADGQADIVEIGRALLADPYLAKKALEDKADDITPCLRCYECFGETSKSETLKCTVNPTMGQQLPAKYGKAAPKKQKKVLIAGGGPAGMQAAVTLAERGHEVTLVDKAGKLGGNLHPAGAPYFKEDILKFAHVLEARVAKAGVTVVLNTEVTPEYVKAFAPDALFVAIGSNELRPPIKGIDLPHVIMAVDAELHPEKLGRRVAIMGGGLVGSEAAVSFSHEGKQCSIIEMKPAVAEEVNSFYRGGLMTEVEKSADIYVNTKVKEIIPAGVLCERDGEEFVVEADSVVCALGFRSPYDKVDALCECADEYYIVGDCSNVGQIYQATNQAYYAALRV
ncbi:FAD-binding protein [Clostridium sp. AF19-22AC]|jgi:2,4-dienoyl-CoA reductase-like NADH-dependent reductase (Old Yellow Enzyme family)/thioredoxin reductase|uniref:oxidoreductase n=1 Tax=Clostridia TaxID=186801 RepID=UPI000E4E860B|nr:MULTISPECIES: FAD-dependent oxidoreductase [Clostridia]RHR33073.1 FAD-binding protein [Clostridium sp. AF19-22AC]